MENQDKLVKAGIDAMSKPKKRDLWIDADGYLVIGNRETNEWNSIAYIPQEHVEPLVKKLHSHDVLLAALKAWQKYDSESGDKHPCPDYTLRIAYRDDARKLTEVVIEQVKGEG